MPAIRPSIPLLALAAAAALSGCGREPAPKAEPPRPVRSVVVAPGAAASPLVLPAEIRPRVETRYGFRIGGKIAERLVDAGSPVRPGQLLARLDPQDVRPAVEAARASLEAARTDARLAATELDRQRALRERSFISQASLDRQQAVLDAARARADAAEAQLRQASNALAFGELRADASGRVVAIEAEAGQVVAAGQAVVRVARAGDVEALVNVPEKDLARVRALRRWQVVVPAAGGQPIEGRVREIAPVADPASRTWAMRLALSGDLAGVELGMTATAAAEDPAPSAGADGFVLPISALYTTDAQPRVWVVDPASRKVRSVPVKTAGLAGDTVRVVGGLSPGDRVVTAGASLLGEGQQVRLLEGDGAAR